jgi:hypothetical protein
MRTSKLFALALILVTSFFSACRTPAPNAEQDKPPIVE